MKKLFVSISVLMAMALVVSGAAFAATTATQTANVSVASLLSIEFAPAGQSTVGSGNLNWTSITPTSNVINIDGHSTTKSDTAVICKYNGTGNWALKMKFVNTGTATLEGKLKYYMGMPYYNGVAANGTLGNPTPGLGQDWPVVPNTDLTVYTAGTLDKTNVPNGTFVGIDYAINPEGLNTTGSYSGTITYTVVGNL